MYRIYRKILCSFQCDIEVFLKKWYISVKFQIDQPLISWSLPDDEGGITCMRFIKQRSNSISIT